MTVVLVDRKGFTKMLPIKEIIPIMRLPIIEHLALGYAPQGQKPLLETLEFSYVGQPEDRRYLCTYEEIIK